MPSIHTYIPKDDIATRRIFYCEGDCPPLGNWPSGKYYGDGSGGQYGQFPATRRCGVSIASLNEQHGFQFGVKYPLPGEIQTVPRAELSAIVTLVEIAEVGANIIYIGDNLPVIKQYNKGEDVCKRSTNADLYAKLFHHIKTRQILLTLFWIPSHLDDPQAKTSKGLPKKRPDWVQDYDIKGNKEADRMAERAAELAQIPELLFLNFKECVDTLRLVQDRLATVILHLPQRKKVKQFHVPKPVPLSKEQAIARSQHCITVEQDTVQCSACLSQCGIISSCFLGNLLKASAIQLKDPHPSAILL